MNKNSSRATSHDGHKGAHLRKDKMNQSYEDQPTKDSGKTRETQKNIIEEQYNQLKHKASELFDEGKEKISNTQETIIEYTGEFLEYVKKHPLRAVLIAGGIGFIVSSLIITMKK